LDIAPQKATMSPRRFDFGALTIDDLDAAQVEIVKVVRRDTFFRETSFLQSTTGRKKRFPGPLRTLNPMLDDGVGRRFNVFNRVFSEAPSNFTK